MNLRTRYMGLDLANPLVVASSPLSKDPDSLSALQETGVAALVTHSLFEREIPPQLDEAESEADLCIEEVRRACRVLDIPTIASLAGFTNKGWTWYAGILQDAGAAALELNLYYLVTTPARSGLDLENRYYEIVELVRKSIQIPIAVKLSPYFSSLSHMARRLQDAGADALVLFNSYYQPDIDPDRGEVRLTMPPSGPRDLRLSLRWMAVLQNRIQVDLAASGGIRKARDVLGLLMAGADVTMICSTLLENGIGQAARILSELRKWLDERGLDSLEEVRGSLSQLSVDDPALFEWCNYDTPDALRRE